MPNIARIIFSYIMRVFDSSWSFSQKSYSQEGEDLILKNIFDGQKNGFYVDVGAHHPFRFSNTYIFYKMGWRGINIDATPGSMKLFQKYRSRDINLEVPISSKSTKIDYYIFDEPALNSFSAELSNARSKNTQYKIQQVVKLQTQKLSQVLANNLPKNTTIDFMSVDVEGFEYEVLVSNNWSLHRPNYLLIEILETSVDTIHNNKIYQLLAKNLYSIVGITGRTIIFKSTKL